MTLLAATRSAVAFVEIGAVALVLSVLARLASRVHVSPIPLYLLAGLAIGKGGVAPLDVSADFISIAGDIGVLLLLLTLGLEYSGEQLRSGLRTGAGVGVVDLALCFTPGFLVGLALGWDVKAALLLGGVTWISSSGVVAKVLTDLGQMRDAATPRLLNVLVIEDLAVAVYLPVVGALVASHTVGGTVVTIAVAVAALAVCLTAAIVWGDRLSRLLHNAGIDSVVLESHDRAYVEGRVRAGLLEQGSVRILNEAGAAGRLMREGLVHHGIELRFGGRGHRTRSVGRFHYAVTLPRDIDPDGVDATLSQGVLTVRIPKSKALKPRRIAITER